MHVDDAANAVIKILKLSDKKFENLVGKNSHINISYGKDYTIKELATILKKISKFNGRLFFNQKMPDGVKRKLMSNELSKKLGFFKNYNFINIFLISKYRGSSWANY